MNPIRILSIAGSDCSGGAGIQADLKTMCQLGCYGMSVICALTAQNTQGVRSVLSVPETFIRDQIDAVMTDIGTDAVKIGMLDRPGVVETVSERLRYYQATRIVVDPVMVSESGCRLLAPEAVDALQRLLFPLADVITPNRYESAVLLGIDPAQMFDVKPSRLKDACIDLAKTGAKAVLLKGGHAADPNHAVDILYIPAEDRFEFFETPRISTRNTHGTGCTLSSALAAFLGMGFSLIEAVARSKRFVQQAIEGAVELRLGKGKGPLMHCGIRI